MSCHVSALSRSPYLTECVLSCQREVEDDVDSYQVPSQSPTAAAPPVVHSAA